MTHLQSKRAAEAPDAPAIVDEAGTITRAQYNRDANRVADALRARGHRAGDVVAIVCGNRREFCEVVTGAGSIGSVTVPVNWHLTPEEIAYILRDSGARTVFVEVPYLEKIIEALEDAPAVETRIVIGSASAEGFVEFETLIDDASPEEPSDQCTGALMFYTSGTTGRPKGVRTKPNVVGGPPDIVERLVSGFARLMQMPERGTMLVTAPIYHGGPYAFCMVPLALGHTVILRRSFDAAETLRLIDEHQVTSMYAVPTHFKRLLALPEGRRRAFDGSSLSHVYHTAAPCPPELKRAMIDWWGPVIHEAYGATEGSFVAFCTAKQWLERPGTVGKVFPTHEVIVVDDDGNSLPAGKPGQIYFKHRMGQDFEYHGDPEKTAKAHLEPGVLTFGDVGYVDDEGFIFLSDRKIDMIISGGVNIYPAEIEACLTSHPRVHDAAVLGVPNDEFGEETKAVVELGGGESGDDALAAELLAHCRAHLAGYKVPRSIDFVDALPRTPTGKLLKRMLRDPYWEGLGRKI